MNPFRVTYRVLFGLELVLHDYPGDTNQFIYVVPDDDTQTMLPGYRILTKKQKNTNVSLISVISEGSDQGSPTNALHDDRVFRFHVKLRDSSFLLQTHLASYDLGNQVLWVGNDVNHVEGGEILLTKAIPNYNNSEEYKPGYLVRSGSNYYRAIRESNSINAHSVSETDYWKNIPNGTFSSQADLQPRPPLVRKDTFMIIDIKHSASLNANYRLLDGALRCREVNYKIKLLM